MSLDSRFLAPPEETPLLAAPSTSEADSLDERKRHWYGYAGKRVLLLQGPVGPYFWQLARELRAAGAEAVYKINFNGGDWLFYPWGAANYRGSMQGWVRWFARRLDEWHIDEVLLFGDCRHLHSVARRMARRRGVAVSVFEEGYIRPNFVTFERDGVNGYSHIPKFPEFYKALPRASHPRELQVGNTFPSAALWAILYYTAATFLWPLYPRYRHHRPLTIFDGLYWVRGYWRKRRYARGEEGIEDWLVRRQKGNYFLVPLQVSTDWQIRRHSNYPDVAAFIQDVVASFARRAPGANVLVLKHHPMDRGYNDYSALVEALRERYGLGDRLLYIHDQHLPTLLEHAAGVVVINSTVGMSALGHKAPLKVMGRAIYDMPGLTFQGPLDEFWSGAAASRPDRALFFRFRHYVWEKTQLNGNFYRRVEGDEC